MTEKQLNWILDHNLDPNQFFTLMLWENSFNNIKVEGWKILLEKKGYLDGNKQITQQGEDLLQEYSSIEEEKVAETSFSLENWCGQVVSSLTDELTSLGYKKGFKGFGGVTFIPSKVEFKKHLENFWSFGYKDYKDYDLIHKCLLEHIKDCHKRGSFAPAIKYFVVKGTKNSHTTYLASAYDNYEEEEEKEIVKNVKTKDLF